MDLPYSWIIKSFVSSGLLYLYYLLCLRNRKFHSYNRFYLLATLIFSILLAFIQFHFYSIGKVQGNKLTNFIIQISSNNAEKTNYPFTTNSLLILGYAVISLI